MQIQPGDWLSFIGSVIGTLVGAVIAIFVMKNTLKDAKQDRILTFCNQIVDESVRVIANITDATMSAQQFLTTAQKNEKIKAVEDFDTALNSIWCLKIKIGAKSKKYKYCDQIENDLQRILVCVNGLTVNKLEYVNENATQGQILALVNSEKYQILLKRLKEFDEDQESINSLRDNVKMFYEINTKKVI